MTSSTRNRAVLARGNRRRIHIPDGPRPHFITHRKGDEWGVVMIHEGREIHWWPIVEARRAAGQLIDCAKLASRPGELPQGDNL